MYSPVNTLHADSQLKLVIPEHAYNNYTIIVKLKNLLQNGSMSLLGAARYPCKEGPPSCLVESISSLAFEDFDPSS